MVDERAIKIRMGLYIPREYWQRYEEDPRESLYYRLMQSIQYVEVWNTWKIPSS